MKKLRGAIIGFGKIAELGHWPSYADSKDMEIVAVMDPSADRRQVAKTLKPDLKTYASADEFFQKEKCDFVDICTPPSSHGALAIQALEHGCHVLCEKPLTLKPTEFKTLAAASTKAKRTVFTVHNWKYAPIFQRTFSIIKEGRIGPVWHVDIFTLRNNVCQGATGAQDPEDWRRQVAVAGGGILVDHGWHAFYLLLNLIKADPQSISAKMLRGQDPSGLEEATQALIQFAEADGFIHLTWRADVRRNHAVIQGKTGTILIDDNRILLSTHDGWREEIKFDAALSAGSHHADWFKSLLPDFLAEMNNPDQRGQNLREAAWCVALTDAAYQSDREAFMTVDVGLPGRPTSAPALA